MTTHLLYLIIKMLLATQQNVKWHILLHPLTLKQKCCITQINEEINPEYSSYIFYMVTLVNNMIFNLNIQPLEKYITLILPQSWSSRFQYIVFFTKEMSKLSMFVIVLTLRTNTDSRNRVYCWTYLALHFEKL